MAVQEPDSFIRRNKRVFIPLLGLLCIAFAWMGIVSSSSPVLEEQHAFSHPDHPIHQPAPSTVALTPPVETPPPTVIPTPPQAPTALSVKRLPQGTVKQGQSVIVTVTAPEAKPPAKVTLGKRTAKFFKQSNPGSWQAVIGLSIDEPVGAKPLIVSDASGQILHQESATIAKDNFGRQNIRVSSKTGGLQAIPGELAAIGKLKTTLTGTRHWQLPFVPPTPDCQNSPFGTRRYHNGTYSGNYHKGVDLRSPNGRPIKAIAGGKVQIATLKYRLHGGTVGLDHGQGFTSIYIHMSKILVKPGQIVKKGQVIGNVGSSGFATGPHLHWGLYANGVPVNPNQFVKYHRC